MRKKKTSQQPQDTMNYRPATEVPARQVMQARQSQSMQAGAMSQMSMMEGACLPSIRT